MNAPVTIPDATEAQAEKAVAILKRAIEAAENSNQAGENFVVGAVNWEASRDLCATYRDIFAEITAKAIPYCGDASDPERITGYRLHTGPLHRAAGKLGFQMFDGEARMSALVERNQALSGALKELSEAADDVNAEQDRQLADERRAAPHDLADNFAAPVEVPERMWRRLNAAIIVAQGHDAAAAAGDLLAFAEKWMSFAKATFAPVDIDAGLRELGDDHELTLTCAQFVEFTDLARAAIAKALGQ